MTAPTADRRAASPLELAPIGLALLAEAAWTNVLAGLLQVIAHVPPTLGLPAMLLAAVGGWIAARRLGHTLGDRWPYVAGTMSIAVAVGGWLWAPAVRAILVAGGPGAIPDALLANPGGFVAGVAFLRGIAHARLPPDPRPIATVLAVGIPGIAVAAILGGMIADPWRAEFRAEATTDVLVFLVAGTGALTLSRLTLVGSGAGTGVDWRRNPGWLALVALLLGGIAVAAVAASLVAGPAIVVVLSTLVPSLLVVGLIAGFDRRSIRVLLASVAVALALGQLLRLLGARPSVQEALPPVGVPVPGDAAVSTPVVIGAVVVAAVVAAIAAIVLVRLWMRRPRVVEDDLDEERWIDHGELGARDAGRRRRRRGGRFGRRAPADAVAAYRMLLEDLASRPRVRREPAETPAEHAGRLRAEGWGALSLDLLAADYGLVRFGGRDLTPREERRAIARAGALRRRLTGPATVTGTEGEAAATRPTEAEDTGTGPGARSRFRLG